jgi:acetyl-CoA acetyltransferase
VNTEAESAPKGRVSVTAYSPRKTGNRSELPSYQRDFETANLRRVHPRRHHRRAAGGAAGTTWHHADDRGHSTPLTDGASAIVLASGERAAELGVEPLARVVSSAVYALDPLIMGLAPAWALPLAIKRAGLTPEQIDVWEVHEAFSAQALGVLRELPKQLGGFTVPDDKLTPNGGAVAIGHPFGATGTRYVLTLATELRERNVRYGAVGVCVGSGQGVAVVLENPNAT